MIIDNLRTFIDTKLKQLTDLKLDVSSMQLDHFGYQISSKEDYDTKTIEVSTVAERKSENIVGGRRVGIYRLHEPYKYSGFTILGFELVEPRAGQVTDSRLDHLEFVLPVSFEKYVENNPQVDWDTTAMNRPEFAKLTVKFDDGTSVKFHLKNIFEEIPN